MNPFKGEALKDLTSLQERMNRIFTESVKRIKEMAESEDSKTWSPPVDIVELDDRFIMMADVPGVPKDRITVEVQGGALIIRGERPRLSESAVGTVHRSERMYGDFERTFNLPIRVDADQIQARTADGVLKITINKPVEENRIQVNVE